jgi:hypothetical protein
MRKSDVFLFTSDRREGWGAVANEAMNSGCAVLADAMIGAVPYLLRSGWNGAVYSRDRWGFGRRRRSLYEEWLEKLATDRKTREYLARNAYATIAEKWNPEHAAENLLGLMKELMGAEAEDAKEETLGKDGADQAHKNTNRTLSNSNCHGNKTDGTVKITDDFIEEPCSPEEPMQENRIRKNAMRGISL